MQAEAPSRAPAENQGAPLKVLTQGEFQEAPLFLTVRLIDIQNIYVSADSALKGMPRDLLDHPLPLLLIY